VALFVARLNEAHGETSGKRETAGGERRVGDTKRSRQDILRIYVGFFRISASY